MTSIVVTSDTHCTYPELPEGDLLLHCGDFTFNGFRSPCKEVIGNRNWLQSQSHKFKKMVGVAGNHDWDFDTETFEPEMQLLFNQEIEFNGLRIYGTPNTPMFCGWAFMHSEIVLEDIFSKIPEGLDILISHGPAHKLLDVCPNGFNAGSKALRQRLFEMDNPPKYVFSGHIHIDDHTPKTYVEMHGIKFYNVAYVNEMYKPVNPILQLEI